ncbi:Ribosome production factor 2 [Thelohanellus kitauei]|uniref:Ribosome production factor 2 homolog n=1 Tax=Thelohanellus kitauei TaxID=669202 RepID=A0A0C2J186_THEKT|nr:Ribosome production factor 2 [Thelohanellus kitauei]
MDLIRKPKTHKGKKYLESLEKEPVDGIKKCLLLRQSGSGQVVTNFLKDICALKVPDAEIMKYSINLNPFNDSQPITKVCRKFNIPLFITGSNTKKRPNNLVIGRFYNRELLDFYEFGVNNYKPIDPNFRIMIESGEKPAIFFMGHEFENDPNYMAIKNILTGIIFTKIDFWAPKSMESIVITDIKLSIVFAIGLDGIIFMRCYRIVNTKVDGQNVEDFHSIGPSADLEVRRLSLPDSKIFKQACQKDTKIKKVKKEKNVSYDDLGAKTGSIYLQKQPYDKLKVSRPKALKRKYTHKSQVDLQE